MRSALAHTFPEAHIRRAVLLHRAPDAQLTEVIPTPALNAASTGHERACVVESSGDGGIAW
jgi:hypothetical protein